MTKLPDDAFLRYVALGVGRSYDELARQLGVSKRAVAKRAAAEDWQERLAAMSKQAQDAADAALTKTLEEQKTRHAP